MNYQHIVLHTAQKTSVCFIFEVGPISQREDRCVMTEFRLKADGKVDYSDELRDESGTHANGYAEIQDLIKAGAVIYCVK